MQVLHIDHIQGQGYLEKEYFVEKEKMYDVKRYTKLLADCCITVTKSFGMEIVP